MLGLGGKEHTLEHAEQTARFLNQVHPFELTVVTLVLFKNAPLVQKVRHKKFHRLSIYESIVEEQYLLELLQNDVLFNATHKTNALILKGKLPEQKEWLLQKISHVLMTMDPKTLSLQEIKKWQRWDKE